ALGIAAPAAASTTQQSLMQDDDLVLYRGPDVQASTLQRMAGLGVDTVRINLIWRNVVGKGGRKAQPTRRTRPARTRTTPLRCPRSTSGRCGTSPTRPAGSSPSTRRASPPRPGSTGACSSPATARCGAPGTAATRSTSARPRRWARGGQVAQGPDGPEDL